MDLNAKNYADGTFKHQEEDTRRDLLRAWARIDSDMTDRGLYSTSVRVSSRLDECRNALRAALAARIRSLSTAMEAIANPFSSVAVQYAVDELGRLIVEWKPVLVQGAGLVPSAPRLKDESIIRVIDEILRSEHQRAKELLQTEKVRLDIRFPHTAPAPSEFTLALHSRLTELDKIRESSSLLGAYAGRQSLERWVLATAAMLETAHYQEAKQLRLIQNGFIGHRDGDLLPYELNRCRAFLEAILKRESVFTERAECAFIAHGRSLMWLELQRFLEKGLGITTLAFEDESAIGKTPSNHVADLMSRCTLSLVVCTGDDTLSSGVVQPRQNVCEELGRSLALFGPRRTIVLVEDGCTLPSNDREFIHIPFPKGNVRAVTERIRTALGALPASMARSDPGAAGKPSPSA